MHVFYEYYIHNKKMKKIKKINVYVYEYVYVYEKSKIEQLKNWKRDIQNQLEISRKVVIYLNGSIVILLW